MGETTDILQLLTRVWAWVFETLLPFTPGSRLHWTGLLAFFVLSAGIYLSRRTEFKGRGEAGFIRFLFPRHMYFSKSSLVDLKIYFGNKLFKPFIDAAGFTIRVLIIMAVAKAIGGAVHLEGSGTPPWSVLLLATLAATLARDFAYYINHKLHHENKYLWPFHKVHHSAEHLTPITAFRNHPVFDLGLTILASLMSAPITGLIFGLFGLQDELTIFGVALFIALLNFAGGALRHSHIWLDYGPVLSRIFISPAQHQIHHSLAPRHHDKNYGLIFAFWDGMFGTLYVPKTREALSFGVADAAGVPLPQVHNTLWQAWCVPFLEFAKLREAEKAETDASSETSRTGAPI